MKNFKKFWKLGKKEFNTKHFDTNAYGELIIREGHYQYNVHDLVRKFGSPLEIYTPFILEDRLENLFDVFNKNIKKNSYKGKFQYHYPMKVNQNREFVLPLVSEGAHMEVSSVNELWLIKNLWEQGNFSTKIRVLCSGPKTAQYIQLIDYLRDKNLSIVPSIESLHELKALKHFKGEFGIRVNLQSKVKSRWDKKVDRFGFRINEILEMGKIRNLKILHYHIGSQIQHGQDIVVALKEAFSAYHKIRAINRSLDTIDVGGGFAVPYEKKKLYSVETIAEKMIKSLKTLSDKEGIPHPNLIVEWGRYLAAPAQITLFKVLDAKDIPKATAKQWYIIDGSFMTDLLDTWAIHQKWHIVPVNNMKAEKRRRVWLAGLSCDSDDKYTASDGYVLLPRLEDLEHNEDQYLAVLDTGAYQDAFSMHHCLMASPAKIMLENGLVTIIRRRQSSEEIGRKFGWYQKTSSQNFSIPGENKIINTKPVSKKTRPAKRRHPKKPNLAAKSHQKINSATNNLSVPYEEPWTKPPSSEQPAPLSSSSLSS